MKATAQGSTNVEASVKALEKRLVSIENELDGLRQKGFHGYFDESHPKPSRDHFLENYRKLEYLN
jgi:hypothetical protein